MPTTDDKTESRLPDVGTGGPGPSALRFEVATSLEELEALAPAWRRLLGDRQVFVGPDWTIEWLRGPGARSQPFVVAARAPDGSVLGVLPLHQRRGVLATCGAEHGLAHVDVVAAHGLAADVAEGAMATLEGHRGSQLRLERLSLDGALLAAVRRRAGRLTVLERFGAACPYMTVKSDWTAQLAGMERHHRHEINRQMRRFSEKPGTSVRWVRDPADVDAAMTTLFDLHERRFAASGRPTVFRGPVIRAFHTALAKRLVDRDALVLGLLVDEERPVAAAYGFATGASMSFFNAGMDPEAARIGAGYVLRGYLMKDAVIGAGRTDYDLLEGCQEWKLRWATGVRPLVDVDVFPAGVLGAAAGRLTGLARAVKKRAAVAVRGERGPGSPDDEPADPKHCRRLGCPYAPAAPEETPSAPAGDD